MVKLVHTYIRIVQLDQWQKEQDVSKNSANTFDPGITTDITKRTLQL